MASIKVAAVALSCFLHYTLTAGLHKETKFTMEPEKTLFVDSGSNATFRWKCSFGNAEDWINFEQVFWGGETDKYGNIGNKFLTIDSSEKVWTNPNLPYSVSSRAVWSGTLTQHSCQLVFCLRNVIVSDDGTYGCTGIVYGETFKSSSIRLIVLEPPKLVSRSNRTIDVAEGKLVTLYCKVTGNPVPSILWMHNGRILPQKGSVLKISRIQLGQGGIYNCTATNLAGNVSEGFSVRIVSYKPYENQNASSKSVVKTRIGRETTLKCAVVAKPPATFTWRKVNEITAGVNSTENLSILKFTPRGKGDLGNYFCMAGNDAGITSIAFKVTDT